MDHSVRRFLALGLLLALTVTAFAAPEDEDDFDFVREALLREARRAAPTDATAPTDLTDAMAALEADIAFLADARTQDESEARLLAALQQTVEERKLLIGEPLLPAEEEAPGEPPAEIEAASEPVFTPGAIQQARDLYEWLLGRSYCAVEIQAMRGGKPVGAPTAHEWMKPAEPAAGGEAPAAEGGEANGGELPTPPPGEGAASPAPDGEGEQPAPPAEAPAPEEPAPPPPAARPPTIQDWAREVQAKRGSLASDVIRTVACFTIDRLEEARERPLPDFEGGGEEAPTGRTLRRFALLPEEEPFAYNAAFVSLRREQSKERITLFGEEKAPGLVDEVIVREKARRAATLREAVTGLETHRDTLRQAMFSLAEGLDLWKFTAAELASRIEEERERIEAARPAGAGDGEGAEEPSAVEAESLLLRVLEAWNATVTLEIRLLYATALRTDERLTLLDQLILAAGNEAGAAEGARDRFQTRLTVLRQERRLDRLEHEARTLRQSRRWAESRAKAPGVWQDRLAAVDAVLALNAVVQEAVRRRRSLSESQREAPAPPPSGPPPSTAPGDDSEEGETVVDPIALHRAPRSRTWTLDTIRQSQEALAAHGFPRDLVAEHHEVADETISALRAALDATGGLNDLSARFEQAKAAADAALAKLTPRDYFARTARLAPTRDIDVSDFGEAIASIEAERGKIRERIVALQAYRHALENQGRDSFGVRINRDLGANDLGRAFGETTDALENAGRWLSFEGEDNLGTWARRNWLGLLAFLAVIAAGFLLVRYGRRGLDSWLERRASRTRELRWTGASMREEREMAKERKAQEKAAAEASEEAILREAEGAGEEARPLAPEAAASESSPDASSAKSPPRPRETTPVQTEEKPR
ncbi:MAG: hypothetical protein ACYTG6_05105 [Planctomycetota bacterium]|jgi:hypothetical protein